MMAGADSGFSHSAARLWVVMTAGLSASWPGRLPVIRMGTFITTASISVLGLARAITRSLLRHQLLHGVHEAVNHHAPLVLGQQALLQRLSSPWRSGR